MLFWGKNGMKRVKEIDITQKRYKYLLFVSCLLVTVSIVLGVLFAIYGWVVRQTKETITQNVENELTNLNFFFTRQMDSYRELMENSWRSSTVRSYIYSTSSSEMQRYRVALNLNSLTGSLPEIEYVCLFSDKDGYRYFGSRYPGKEEKNLLEEKVQNSTNDLQYFYLNSESREDLCIFMTERKYMGEKPYHGIVFAIDLNKMQNKRDATTDQPFLILDKDGNALIHKNIAVKNVPAIWAAVSEKNDGSDINIEGQRYILTTLENDFYGLTLVRLSGIDASREQLNEFIRFVFIVLVISLMIGFAMAWWISLMIYSPLNRFLGRLRVETLPVHLEGVTQKTDDTSEKIISRIDVLSRQYHNNHILAYLEEKSEDDRVPEELRVEKGKNHEAFVLVQSMEKQIREDIPEAFRKEMGKRFATFQTAVYYDCRNKWFLVTVKEADSNRVLYDEQLGTLIWKMMHKDSRFADLHVVISRVMDNSGDLMTEFQQVLIGTKHFLFDPEQRVLTSRDFSFMQTGDVPDEITKNYYNKIKKADLDGAKQNIPFLIGVLGAYRSRDAIRNMAHICLNVEQCALNKEMTMKQRQEHTMDHYIKLSELTSREELVNYLENITEDACLENKVYMERSSRLDILTAIQYIREHFTDKDISVDRVSEEFGISGSYFSKTFNENVGMTFPEYVTDMRMTYAHELLEERPELSIKKAAEMCGFNGVSYFSAQYKKKYGVSPSQRRKTR